MQIEDGQSNAAGSDSINVLPITQSVEEYQNTTSTPQTIEEAIAAVPKDTFIREAHAVLYQYLEVVGFIAPRHESYNFPFFLAQKPNAEMIAKFVSATPVASLIIDRLCSEEINDSARVLLLSAKNCFSKTLRNYHETKKWQGEFSFECQAGSNLLETGMRLLAK